MAGVVGVATTHRRSSSLTSRDVDIAPETVISVKAALSAGGADWVLLGYGASANLLEVIKTGCTPADGALHDNLPAAALVYGVLRVHPPGAATPEAASGAFVVSFAYLGRDAPITARAKWTAHRKGFLLQVRRHIPVHDHVEAQKPTDLEPAALLRRLAHKRPPSSSADRRSPPTVAAASPQLGRGCDLSDPNLRRVFECIHSEDELTNWMVCGYSEEADGTRLVALAHGNDPFAALAGDAEAPAPGSLYNHVTPSDSQVRYIYFRLNSPPRVVSASGHTEPAMTPTTSGRHGSWGIKSPDGAATYVLVTWLGTGQSGEPAQLHRTPGKEAMQARAAIVAHSGAVRHFFVHHIHISAAVHDDISAMALANEVRKVTHVDHIRLTVEVLSSDRGASLSRVTLDVGCGESLAKLKAEVEARVGAGVTLYRLDQAAPHTSDSVRDPSSLSPPPPGFAAGHARRTSPRTLTSLAQPLPADDTSVSRWCFHGDTIYAQCDAHPEATPPPALEPPVLALPPVSTVVAAGGATPPTSPTSPSSTTPDVSRSIAVRKNLRLADLLQRQKQKIQKRSEEKRRSAAAATPAPEAAAPPPARPLFTPGALQNAMAGLKKRPPPADAGAGEATSGVVGGVVTSTEVVEAARSDAGADLTYLEVNFDQVERLNVLGEGRTAVVYRALWHGGDATAAGGDATGFEVAVKVFKYIRALPPPAVKTSFRKELAAMHVLQHPNLVTILGATTHPKLAIVMAYCSQGTMYGVVRDSSFSLSALDRCNLGLDVARGLAHLHANKVIHRDVKTSNVLLDLGPDRLMAKLADFGSVYNLSGVDDKAFTELGTSGYTSPEVLGGIATESGYGTSADVWSFGVILWELFCEDPRQNRFVGVPPVRYCRALETGQRLDFPADADPDVVSLVAACWEWLPTARPTMTSVVAQLEAIAARLGGATPL